MPARHNGNSDLTAVILVGGLGTRLRPLTERLHKSLVPVLNRPFMDLVLAWLAEHGTSRTVFAIGLHNQDLATAYAEGEYFGLRVEHVFEAERLESGGAIRNACAAMTSRFIVMNGDIYSHANLVEMVAEHRKRSAELSLAVSEVDDPSQFGVVCLDDSEWVTAFVEKPPRQEAPSRLVNAGVWIFEPHLVREIPQGPVRVEETLFPKLVAERRRVLGQRFEGPWVDVGTPARYRELNMSLLDERSAGGLPAVEIAPTAVVGPGAAIQRSVVGPDSIVENRAHVADSVVWARVRVGAAASIVRSVIADDVTVGPGAQVVDSVVGPGRVIPAQTVICHSNGLEDPPNWTTPGGHGAAAI